jgi:2-C-methyl-D-erythritol 2,4-cyclodiphosphate synthase
LSLCDPNFPGDSQAIGLGFFQLQRVVVGFTASHAYVMPRGAPHGASDRRQFYLGSGEMIQIGMGYDIHRLVAGRELVLGGVRIPFEMGLLGHSDADVLVHAICDALLGACGLGDIGMHFPDSDESLRDVSSIILLEKIVKMVRQAGYAIGNVDATLIAEAPRIGSLRQRMRENLAQALDIEVERVSVKATTHETLGPIGRGEGIAAQCVALVVRNGPKSEKA